MKPLCVIPARGGSKRLPRKNLAPVGGRPMVAWTIEAARDSGIFDRVTVTTEDAQIAEAAEKAGAEVPYLRPEELAGDTVTNVAVSIHHAAFFAAKGEAHDAVVCLQPSSPLRSGAQIRAAWQAFVKSGADFLASVTPIDPHFFHWALRPGADGNWEMVFGDTYMTVRQELPKVYRPNGAIKIARIEALRRQGDFFGPSLAAYEMPEESAVHVATAFDLAVVEALLAGRKAA